ncbi:hypothetical protein THRCLA_21031 [Thraustotheca clavata]|uniref:Uncharacterized protein n=1 Tax=Thraustotheca clavata TaxID=74557 RepID=A0A1W0A0V7_9STRA|nr:hypothetical protein THRCLA_21031 [Thraustotheca clavata]
MPRGKKRSSEAVDSTSTNVGSDVALEMQLKRTNNSTKQTYHLKINALTEWLQLNYPEAVNHSKSINVPLPSKVVLAFFGELSKQEYLRYKGLSEDDETPLSASCVKVKCELNTESKILLDGYEKTINDLKKRGLMSILERKRHLKFNGYSYLALKLMTPIPVGCQSWSTTLFSWPYFAIMWNLMSRNDSIDSIMLQHIDWQEDSLIIEEQGHKGDQTGADKEGEHVYANSNKPQICPILALSNRFGNILRRVLDNIDLNELQHLGCPPEDIDAHSLRKACSTYALGQVNEPNPVSVFLGMEKLKDRYVHFGEGADQLCGRMVCGLPFNSRNFGALPPHFPNHILSQLNDKFWDEIVPNYCYYPRGIKRGTSFYACIHFLS